MTKLLAMPLFNQNSEAEFDVGQGFPSHILLVVSEGLVSKIKLAQACVVQHNFDSVCIKLEELFCVVDVVREFFSEEINLPVQSFTTSNPNNFDELVTIDLITAELSMFNYLAKAHTSRPSIIVGRTGFWVELTHNHPSVCDNFISASKDIEKLQMLLDV